MKKKENWMLKFFDFTHQNYYEPFIWGKWDCCMFSDACIKEMTGENLIPKKLKWTDEKSAMQAIKDYGGTLAKSIDKAAKAKKLKSVKPVFLQCGDLVIWKEETEMCGMYDGQAILCPSENGIEVKPTNLAIKGWRING